MPLQPLRTASLTIPTERRRRSCRPRRAVALALLVCVVTACAPNGGTSVESSTAQQAENRSTVVATPVPSGEAPRRAPTLGGGAVGTTIELPDTAWSGGYQSSDISTPSGGIATMAYGGATQYNVLRASFRLEAQPFGTVELSLEGVDSPGADKTPILIAVNDQEIYNGPNLLPDSDDRAEPAVWGSYTWSFNAQMLHPGQNTITIHNLSGGAVDQAPFFMVDYAELTYQDQ